MATAVHRDDYRVVDRRGVAPSASESFSVMRPSLDPAVRALLRDAPSDSAIGRARAFGIDVGALAFRLATTTPIERLRELDARIEEIKRIKRGLP